MLYEYRNTYDACFLEFAAMPAPHRFGISYATQFNAAREALRRSTQSSAVHTLIALFAGTKIP